MTTRPSHIPHEEPSRRWPWFAAAAAAPAGGLLLPTSIVSGLLQLGGLVLFLLACVLALRGHDTRHVEGGGPFMGGF
jgi:hypothetical protein